jgi:hypothetical protein
MSVLSPPVSTKDTTAKGAEKPTSAAPDVKPAQRPATKQPRPRASLMATIALALAVAAVLTVATGVLAALGAALGLLAVIFAVGGILATRHRHVAGTGNAALGLLLGLVALAVGALATTGTVTWFDTTTNYVTRLYEWLGAYASWATPNA